VGSPDWQFGCVGTAGVVAVVVGAGVTVVLVVVGVVVVVVVGAVVVLVDGFGVDVVELAGAESSSSSPFDVVVRFGRLPAVAPSEALSMSVPSTVGVEQATTVPTTPARSSQPARRA
jgi:hypothetical protein